jgi:type III pantothenate kinase
MMAMATDDWQTQSPALAAWSDGALPPIVAASVVPNALDHWQRYPHLRTLTLADIGLAGGYPTLGIDRALAVWGAGQHYGWPVLVIDAGTALTLTGADHQGTLVGGAILPGVTLQAQSLHQETAALPGVDLGLAPHPPLWAQNTADAIASGILNGAIATLLIRAQLWCMTYPKSQVVITGGDGEQLLRAMREGAIAQKRAFGPNLDYVVTRLQWEPLLVLQGMIDCVINSN